MALKLWKGVLSDCVVPVPRLTDLLELSVVSQGDLLGVTRTPASSHTLHAAGSSAAREWRGTWKRWRGSCW